MATQVLYNEIVISKIINYIGTGYYCKSFINKNFNNSYKKQKINERKNEISELNLNRYRYNNVISYFYFIFKDSQYNYETNFVTFQYSEILQKYGFIYACQFNNIKCLKYLHETEKSKITNVALSVCLQNGSFECLLYCLNHINFSDYYKNLKIFTNNDISTFCSNSENNSLNILYDIINHCYDNININGLLKCLQFVHINNIIEWDTKNISDAILHRGYDYPQIMQYAIDNGCNFDYENTTIILSERGSVKCLDFALKQYILCDINLCCNIACQHEQINVLQYFHDVLNYEFLFEQYKCAAHFQKINVLKYLYSIKKINDPILCSIAADGCEQNCESRRYWIHDLKCLQFLHQQGCDWDKQLTINAVLTGFIEGLQYAIKHGCPYDEETYEQAIFLYNNYDYAENMLKYLDEINCPKPNNISINTLLPELQEIIPHYIYGSKVIYDESFEETHIKLLNYLFQINSYSYRDANITNSYCNYMKDMDNRHWTTIQKIEKLLKPSDLVHCTLYNHMSRGRHPDYHSVFARLINKTATFVHNNIYFLQPLDTVTDVIQLIQNSKLRQNNYKYDNDNFIIPYDVYKIKINLHKQLLFQYAINNVVKTVFDSNCHIDNIDVIKNKINMHKQLIKTCNNTVNTVNNVGRLIPDGDNLITNIVPYDVFTNKINMHKQLHLKKNT